MSSQRIASRTRRVRHAGRTKARLVEHPYGVPVPEGLHEAIETERGNLSKAESVLGCLVISMEYDTEGANKPYYPDVAQLARELVRQSIGGLDALVLQQRLLRNKIKEHAGASFAEGGYACHQQFPSLVHGQEQTIPVHRLNPTVHQ
jgi:hypothetical protein